MLIVLFTLTLFGTLLVAQEKPLLRPTVSFSKPDLLHQDSEANVKKINLTLDQIHQALVKDKDKFGLGPSDPGYETSSSTSMTEDIPNGVVHDGKDEAQVPLLETQNTGTVEVASANGNRASQRPSIDTTDAADKAAEIKRLLSAKEEAAPLITNPNLVPLSEKSKRYFSYFYPRKQLDIPLTRWTVTTFQGFKHIVCLRLMRLMPTSIQTLLNVPASLKRLALANYCSWTAVMGFNLFYSDFVGQAVFKGNPNSEESVERALYDEGVRMASWGLLFHCITSALYAAVIDRLVTRYSMRTLYCVGMFSFSFAMAAMLFVRNIYVVNLMAACTGFAYATVTTIPFMLVQKYHNDKEVSSD